MQFENKKKKYKNLKFEMHTGPEDGYEYFAVLTCPLKKMIKLQNQNGSVLSIQRSNSSV